MSAILTRIRVPKERGTRLSDWGYQPGLADWGRKTRAEMIDQIRARALHYHALADAIDTTPDDEFEVHIVRGSAIQRPIEELKP
jgi:hypothetical protein